jgi:hypothetical protein
MRREITACAAAALIVLAGARAVAAAEPVALVEDLEGTVANLAPMDYLQSGRVLKLGGKDRLVLDYLGSCVRETVTGGTVTIGEKESRVAGGSVKREKVQCDGGKLLLSSDQAAKSGVVVFRAPPKAKPGGEAAVQRTLYGVSPLIDLRGGGHLVIERLDRPEPKLELDIPAGQLLRGAFYDFAKANRALAPGGTYRAAANGRSLVFRIDPYAKPGEAPIASRLLRL